MGQLQWDDKSDVNRLKGKITPSLHSDAQRFVASTIDKLKDLLGRFLLYKYFMPFHERDHYLSQISTGTKSLYIHLALTTNKISYFILFVKIS